MNGFVIVSPHKSPDDHGPGMPLGSMKAPSKRNVGKVRVGFGDGVVVVGFHYVPIAPVFDPDAVSMVPIPGWLAPVAMDAAA